MTPQSQPPEDKDSSRVNLLISFAFHAALVLIVFYFAARQGFLGNQMQKITVQLIKVKPPEARKPAPKPPPEVPKPEPVKVAAAPKAVERPKANAAPAAAPPIVAPPPTELPTFDFDGGRSVVSSSDPVEIYRSAIELAFRSKWNRPENLSDDDYAVDVQVAVQPDGEIRKVDWERGSGNVAWDESVRKAIAAVKRIDNAPPTNFPPYVNVRFDVQEQTEPILQ
jgi:type IV secretory pathway VirB10-like protein